MPTITPIPFEAYRGMLYRSPMPFAHFDPNDTTLEEFIQADVNTVVMLTEEGEDIKRAGVSLKALYQENGLDVLHFPIVDFAIPEDPNTLRTLINQISEKIRHGERVAVHCYAGQGRTGLVIALLGRQLLGLDGDEAIDWVRGYFRAIETKAQEKFVRDFKPE